MGGYSKYMIVIKDKKECCGCEACLNICPLNAISMQKDNKGFKYPVVNKDKCIDCKLCEKVCPIQNSNDTKVNPMAYACFNKDLEERKNSSSGGIFVLLALKILKRGGVVIGASFKEDYTVSHICIDKIDDLIKIQTSKYVQSNINDSYTQAKEYLDNNQEVLFTGTACQIAGLKNFLKKDYNNLYTQDIICHGVPSEKIWNKYIEYRKKKDKQEKIEKIEFRNKDNGWINYGIKFKYSSKQNYYKNHYFDSYMKLFLSDLILRDSCFSCKFKEKNRLSDLTLADFWGLDKIVPEMNDNMGTSLVILNTKKGEKLFAEISEQIKSKEVNFKEAIKYNTSYCYSAKEADSIEKFWKDADLLEIDQLEKKYIQKRNVFHKIFYKIKSIIKD